MVCVHYSVLSRVYSAGCTQWCAFSILYSVESTRQDALIRVYPSARTQQWHSVSNGHFQVDLIVCFDSDASPIRNIQRMGRTGRHKPGRVVYIMSQGKEEDSYRKGLQVRLQPFTS